MKIKVCAKPDARPHTQVAGVLNKVNPKTHTQTHSGYKTDAQLNFKYPYIYTQITMHKITNALLPSHTHLHKVKSDNFT